MKEADRFSKQGAAGARDLAGDARQNKPDPLSPYSPPSGMIRAIARSLRAMDEAEALGEHARAGSLAGGVRALCESFCGPLVQMHEYPVGGLAFCPETSLRIQTQDGPQPLRENPAHDADLSDMIRAAEDRSIDFEAAEMFCISDGLIRLISRNTAAEKALREAETKARFDVDREAEARCAEQASLVAHGTIRLARELVGPLYDDPDGIAMGLVELPEWAVVLAVGNKLVRPWTLAEDHVLRILPDVRQPSDDAIEGAAAEQDSEEPDEADENEADPQDPGGAPEELIDIIEACERR